MEETVTVLEKDLKDFSITEHDEGGIEVKYCHQTVGLFPSVHDVDTRLISKNIGYDTREMVKFESRFKEFLLKRKSLAAYIEKLKLRILGEEVPAVSYDSLETLYDELVKYYSESLKLDDLTPYLFASYTLLTHQTPNLEFIFQIYITGMKGSGKSTAGERLEKLCYQGFKTGCATFPFLVRANEVLNGMTQVLDEFDLICNDEHVTKYLRGSTDRGNPYGLVEGVTIGNVTHQLPAVKMSFGPRILITSQHIRDEMVRDRAVEVVMMQYADYLGEPSNETVTRLRGQLRRYREQVKLSVSNEDKKKWYDAKHRTGRLNETATLLYLGTPEKYHDKIADLLKREWETRTQLERESYTAKVVEALTAAIQAEDTVESSTARMYVPVQQIKKHFDLRNADPVTGKGKASLKSIGRVIQNLGLHTDTIRVRDEQQQRLRAWLLNKDTLTRIRQTLYLDQVESPDLGTSVTSGTSPSAPLGIEKRELASTRSNVPLVPLVSKSILKTVCGVCYKKRNYERLGIPVKGKVSEGTCQDCGAPAELLVQIQGVSNHDRKIV